jgi:hypothetical protein
MMPDDEMVQVPRREWEALRAEVAELQRTVHRSSDPRPPLGDGRTDRRGLLKHGAMLAASAAAGGALTMVAEAQPAAATTGTMSYGQDNNAGADSTLLYSTNSGSTLGLTNYGDGAGLLISSFGAGAPLQTTTYSSTCQQPAASFLQQGVGDAVVAILDNGPGSALAANAQNTSTGSAISAVILNSANSSPVITGYTDGTGETMHGEIVNATSAAAAIHGATNGTGPGLVGQITNPSNSSAAVAGVTNGTGSAFGALAAGAATAVNAQVWGTGSAVVANIAAPANSQAALTASTSGSGAAIQGTATGTGSRGGVFGGVAAQVKLSPGAGSTHPTSGQTGDLYLDSTARLWLCTVGATTATWRQLQVI